MDSSFLSVVQGERVDLVEEKIKLLINGRLAELLLSPSARFVEFPVFFKKSLRSYILKEAASKGLKSRTYLQHGVKYIKVYKGEDGSPSLRLTDMSKKVIFNYLKKDLHLLGELGGMIAEKCSISSSLPVYKFCTSTMSKNGCSPPHSIQNKVAGQLLPNVRAIRSKQRFIDAIFHSQVTILYSDSLGGRITEVPQCLLDEFATLGESCRIICTVGHKLSTVHYSEFVSYQRGERLGLTVGYQIQLESMSSMSTNLLYTTSRFFLRCLFGNRNETFDATTHIIVDDISENDVYGEMLLHEIRQALAIYPDLKVILMCDKGQAKMLQSYFKTGLVLELEIPTKETTIYYLEEIQEAVANNRSQEILCSRILCSEDVTDVLITKCFDLGKKEDFDDFIELQQKGLIDVNVQHSLTKISFGIAASRHDQLAYLTQFVHLGGNLSLMDASNKSALDWALNCRSEHCIQLLHEQAFYINPGRNGNVDMAVQWGEAHRELICNIVNFIESSDKCGSVLILLPSFVEIVKQEHLMKRKIMERAIPFIEIFLLHHNIEIDEYSNLFKPGDSNRRRVILAMDMPISTLDLKDISFIIDSGRRALEMDNYRKEFSWISKSCALKRSQLVTSDVTAFCYRLYSKTQFELFKETAEPDLSNAILGHVCLYAKLLAPHITLRKYFDGTRIQLPTTALEKTVSVLQAIGTFDNNEAITPLGIRIVDIPIDVQLAKVVIFGIVLQCLDPVLTIVSVLAFEQPMEFLQPPLDRDGNNHSDHLMLLRVYQRWTDRSNGEETLHSEDTYISNAKLEVISTIRAQLIGVLRAMSLIQSNGILNIHFINQHANNWPLVKAAFVAGMYENVCQWNRENNQIKGKHNSSMEMSKYSTLMSNDRFHQHDWVVYHAIENAEAESTYTVCNTIISSTTVVLFAGSCMSNIIELIPFMYDDDTDSDGPNCSNEDEVECFTINERLFFTSSREDACLLFELRCKFFNFFNEIVRLFDDPEIIRKTKNNFHDKFDMLISIAHLLQLEDEACNLSEPKRVGERPNTFSSKFKKNQDKITSLRNRMIKNDSANSTSKTYFIIKVQTKEEVKMLIERSKASWNQLMLKCNEQSPVLIFLLLDSSPVFRGVVMLCFDGHKYVLNEIASRDVPIKELKAICFSNGMDSFPGCYDGQELDSMIGSRFLELFL